MTNQRNQQKEKGWKHPPKNWVKVNFDAVIREEKITIAVVTKNKKQKLLSAWTEQLDPSSPLLGEAKVALCVLRRAALCDWIWASAHL